MMENERINEKMMKKSRVKAELDKELKEIWLSGEMKQKIRSAVQKDAEKKNRRGYQRFLRTAAAFAAVIVLGGTTVYAGYRFLNKINVNDQTIPELDPMKKITAQALPGEADEYGSIDADYSSYDEVNGLLGGVFLDSDLEGES